MSTASSDATVAIAETPEIAKTTVVATRNPRRHGRALRRLLDGKTSFVVLHVAQRLEADGYVTFSGPTTCGQSKSSIMCTLTASGRLAAQGAKDGKNPYAITPPVAEVLLPPKPPKKTKQHFKAAPSKASSRRHFAPTVKALP